jgi:threonine synthase
LKFYSTNKKSKEVSFKEAVIQGMAEDGGLFMPASFPILSKNFFSELENISFQEICYEIASGFIGDEIFSADLRIIINRAINFDAPIVSLDENIKVLQLFHGPTLAFKDFGARFMAEIVSYFSQKDKKEITILVATSGDTGSAVANGFLNMEGVNVFILYPGGKVSHIQEMQLTTLDGNITALEVEGTFDDCQKLVKQAFLDKELNKIFFLSSANSINIARLIPQSFYYFNAFKQLEDKTKPLIFSVPSGNFGNLTAGLFAKKMGLPVNKFIAAVNSNDVFPIFLRTGNFTPKPSVKTISNAMDVGNPSNFHRILDLYKKDLNKLSMDIYSSSFSDELTKAGIKKVFNEYKYLVDPHGAVGYLALEEYVTKNRMSRFNGIVLETAHPAKFFDVIENIINRKIDLPDRLKSSLHKAKRSVKISNDYNAFKKFLLSHK